MHTHWEDNLKITLRPFYFFPLCLHSGQTSVDQVTHVAHWLAQAGIVTASSLHSGLRCHMYTHSSPCQHGHYVAMGGSNHHVISDITTEWHMPSSATSPPWRACHMSIFHLLTLPHHHQTHRCFLCQIFKVFWQGAMSPSENLAIFWWRHSALPEFSSFQVTELCWHHHQSWTMCLVVQNLTFFSVHISSSVSGPHHLGGWLFKKPLSSSYLLYLSSACMKLPLVFFLSA